MRFVFVLGFALTASWLVACDIGQAPASDAGGCSLVQVTDFIVSSSPAEGETASYPWCMRRSMPFDAEGHVPCVVVLGRTTPSQSGECQCRGALTPLAAERATELRHTWDDTVGSEADLDCLCEAPQLSGQPLEACQVDADYPVTVEGEDVSGWCFIDSSTFPPVGNPALTAECPEDSQRSVRLLGDAVPIDGAVAMVVCEAGQFCEEL